MASKQFKVPINLVNLASDPGSASEGDIYYNTTSDVVRVYANGSWIAVGSGGGSASDSFKTIAVTGQDSVVADSSTDTLNLVAGTNVFITTDATTDSITVNADSKATSSVYLVRNNTGSTILKGTLVSASGAEPSGRIDVEPFAAVGGINSELTVMGMATANISNGVNGEVISFGTLTGLDTRGNTASSIAVGDETWAEGDILFAHPTVAGKLTKVRPQHDLAVAFITVRHASAGQIAVRIVPGNNHLEWMHDVAIDGTPADNEVLAYDTTSGNWINQTASEAGLATSSDISGLSSVYQPLDAELTAIAGLTSAADRLPYFTGSGTASLATFTSFGRSLVDDADAAASRTTLGLGTMSVESASTYATLASPTFTGTVVLPSTTSIGNITSTELGYVDGVTSAIQTQLNNKAGLTSPTFTTSIGGGATFSAFTTTNNLTIGRTAAYDNRDIASATNNILSGGSVDGINGYVTVIDNYSVRGVTGAFGVGEYIINVGTGTVSAGEGFATKIINIGTGTISGYDGSTGIYIGASGAAITFAGTVSGITKSMVGLANVDNTSDANKPVSSATQTALDAKASTAGKLSQFASTTSAELAGVISNETGTGSLVFSASPSFTGTVNADALTIDYMAGGNNAELNSSIGFYYTESDTANYSTYSRLSSGSYTGIIHRSNQGRASNTTSDFILCQSNTNATPDNDFIVRGDGRIASDVATITSPADYAEYFEWVDGNPNAEDRVGIPVVLVGNKIVEATEDSEDIIGIVSGRPGFIGDTAWSHWNEKYLIDNFGRRIIEDYEVYQWTETDSEGKTKELAYAFDDFIMQDVEVPEDHTVVIQQRDKVNPNYDPDVEYVPREDRQEWDPIGLVGKVRMIKGKPVNPRWRKLQDITDTVEEWFIR